MKKTSGSSAIRKRGTCCKHEEEVALLIQDDDENTSDDETDPSLVKTFRKGQKAADGSTKDDDSSFFGGLSVTEALSRSMHILRVLFTRLFIGTTITDKLILIIGTIFAFIHGITFPFVAVIFGSLTNSYIQQAIQGYANSSDTGLYATKGLYDLTEDLFNLTENKEFLQPLTLPTSQDVGISAELGSIFDLINQIISETFTEKQALTKEQFVNYVSQTGTLFCLLAIVIFVSSFLQSLCWMLVTENQMYRFRQQVFYRILHQDLSWFDRNNPGDLVSHVFGLVDIARNGTSFKMSNILVYFSMFLGSCIICFLVNWHLALIFLVPAPIIIYRILSLGKTLVADPDGYKGLEADRFAEAALFNIDTVVALGEQLHEINRYGETWEEHADTVFKQYHLSAMGKALLTIISYGLFAIAFWYGCKLLMQGTITAGEIYTICLSVTLGIIALMQIISLVPVVAAAFSAAKHLEEHSSQQPKILNFNEHDLGDQIMRTARIPHGFIEFKNVNFTFAHGNQVLNDLSFKIEAGKTVVILGEVGCGKTCLVDLLLRFYDPNSGEIRIDNVNIKKMNVPMLRRNIGVSLQNLILLKDLSTEENIRAGRSEISDKDLLEAVLVVCQNYTGSRLIGDFTADIILSDSKDTSIGKRKIDLARALASKPPILIIDQGILTDIPRNELPDLIKKIKDFRKGQTTIFITNNTLNANWGDLIYVMKNGQITEENIGTHEELIAREGSYYSTLYQRQTMLENLKNQSMQVQFAEDEEVYTFEPEEVKEIEPPSSWFGLIKSLTTDGMKTMWKIGFLGSLLTGVQLTILAFYFVEIFGTFSKKGERLADDGIFWAGMLLLLAFISGLGVWMRTLFMDSAGLYLMLGLKTTTFASVLRRPKAYYDQHYTTPDTLHSNIGRNLPNIRHVLEYHFPEGLSAAITLFFVGVIVTVLVWEIGMIAIFGVLPLLIILTLLQFYYQKKVCKLIELSDNDASKILSQALENIELTQIFCMQNCYLDKYVEAMKPALYVNNKSSFLFSLLFAFSETLFFIFCGVSFIYGAYLIEADVIEPQPLFKIFFSVAFCILLFSQITSSMQDVAEAIVALEDINNLIIEESEFPSSLDAINDEGRFDVETIEGKIEFVNIEFLNQNPPSLVFDGLNLVIPENSFVAVNKWPGFDGVSLFYLIQRFYDPSKGFVLIDGKDLKDYNIRQLREHFGWIPTDITFFSGTLAYNLKYGCKNKQLILKENLEQILSTVKLLTEFRDLLDVYKDEDYWNNLSRGKRVLLAFARALLRNPKILLMDSPTDSLSPEEKDAVIHVIEEVKKDRTCVIVTDNNNLYQLADKVVMLQDGKVIAEARISENSDMQDLVGFNETEEEEE